MSARTRDTAAGGGGGGGAAAATPRSGQGDWRLSKRGEVYPWEREPPNQKAAVTENNVSLVHLRKSMLRRYEEAAMAISSPGLCDSPQLLDKLRPIIVDKLSQRFIVSVPDKAVCVRGRLSSF